MYFTNNYLAQLKIAMKEVSSAPVMKMVGLKMKRKRKMELSQMKK